MGETLGDALPREQARCRELLLAYKEIGPVGIFGVVMIEAALQRTDRAVIAGDLPEMLRCYEELKGFE